MKIHRTKGKISRTIKEYKVVAFGHQLTVPVGSTVTNSTAMGPDDNCRFWDAYQGAIRAQFGANPTMLLHDLQYRGLNIPTEYCEPYN